MSQTDDAPSNAELAERTARIEEQVEHVSETVDRIEDNLNEQHEDLVEDVEQNGVRVSRLWTYYRFGRWILPISVAIVGAIGTLSSAGLI
jgi:N-dimethylarginine dimethylaminohydrolase